MITKDMSQKEVEKFTHACSCDTCNHGCSYGSGILIGKDFERMADLLGVDVKTLKEKYLEEVEQFGRTFFRPKLERKGKPYGKCIFFDGRCKVHEAKPLQCTMSMGCSEHGEDLMLWFMQNHLVDMNDARSKEEFESYKKTGGKTL